MKFKSIAMTALVCHPKITTLYNQSLRFGRLIKKETLSDDAINALSNHYRVFVVKEKKEKHYHFFANWHYLHELKRRNIQKVSAVIFDAVDDKDILQIALSSELNTQVLSAQRASELKQLHDLFAYYPESQRKMLSMYQTTSATKLVEVLSGETRSAIRHQKKSCQIAESRRSPLIKMLRDEK